MDTYTRWDLKERNVWCEDKGFLPCWSQIDCVIITWKYEFNVGTVDPKMRILVKQVFVIMASLEM